MLKALLGTGLSSDYKKDLYAMFFIARIFLLCTGVTFLGCSTHTMAYSSMNTSHNSFTADDVTDHYEKVWKSEPRPRLQEILTNNNVKSCHKPLYKLNTSGRSYLVKCESDLYYIAWLGQGIVGGPYQVRKGGALLGGRKKKQ